MLIYYDVALLCQDEDRPADAAAWFDKARVLAESLGNEAMIRLIDAQHVERGAESV
jgi:hypothetical protein